MIVFRPFIFPQPVQALIGLSFFIIFSSRLGVSVASGEPFQDFPRLMRMKSLIIKPWLCRYVPLHISFPNVFLLPLTLIGHHFPPGFFLFVPIFAARSVSFSSPF